ncbi:flavin reductase (DIM6/NTAB) family NADH-FMN oxidoreductase RutF [Halarchaeum solikamskense]|uniref:flavin reductase family protein n=1 Tax=Halarchaeum nitratireducens TaxID=489913 RepID=UPI001B3A7FAD|nr:flavin reductase family protein [Halarchaeum solikamskense]MBP2250399.1 flavin reductase (DIM6/NTAB) family NADH-FMN oxidoreductase RutF [Halarchaeum solikamskense]
MFERDTDDLSASERERIVKTAVSPRPVAWVGTRDASGADNLAPFSSYTYVGAEDPSVLFTASRRDGELKDTPRNVIDTEVFSVSVATADVLETVDHTAADPEEGDEFDLAGVERAECDRIDAPYVADAPIAMECTLHDRQEIHGRTMLIGDVVRFHAADAAMRDGQVDSREITTIGRLGGPYYTYTESVEFERRY